ncbi:MAG: histidine phosphatase family protein [Candidatus Adiutrix sp.]|jgi:broad specificity phosphatase PhoE|nr:histidine phosphatase family protein [Candidatus Adiutrix sp.]
MTADRPLRLFFLRHGQTENFDEPPFNGWRDAPLTPEGRRQLETAAEALTPIKFDAIYSSDLSRAVYGGRQIAERSGGALIQDAKWREMHFGKWEGWNYSQIAADDRGLIEKLFSAEGLETAFPGGGESYGEFHRRISRALDELLAAHPDGGRVALAAHGGVCKALWSRLLRVPPELSWSIRQDFACLNVADIYADGRQCIAHLVNCYLGPEGYYQSGPGFDRLK